MIRSLRRAVPLLILVFVGAACSGSRETTEPQPPPRAEAPPNAEAPPKPKPAPQTPPKPTTRTVQGFRIQVLTTPEKQAADLHAAEAENWYRSLSASRRPLGLGDRGLLLDVAWRPPYYRVRLGAFASRAEAQRALALVKQRYPEAFLVPDTVTITR